jgi:hypothetical protein
MIWFDYLIAWVITFGLAFSMALTDGPFGYFKKFRKKVRVKYGVDHWISIGVGCPICLSFYLGLFVSLSLGGGVAMWLSAFGFVNVVTSLSPDSDE